MPPAYPFTLVRFTNNTALIQPPEADQRRERNFTPRCIWNFHTEEDAQNWRRIPACERQCEWGWWCQPQSHITTVLLCVCECNCVSVCVCVSEPFLRKRGGQLRSTNMSGWSSEEGSPRPTEVSQCIILLYFLVWILQQALPGRWGWAETGRGQGAAPLGGLVTTSRWEEWSQDKHTGLFHVTLGCSSDCWLFISDKHWRCLKNMCQATLLPNSK